MFICVFIFPNLKGFYVKDCIFECWHIFDNLNEQEEFQWVGKEYGEEVS